MKIVFAIIICLFGLNLSSQNAFLGFSSPICSQPMTNVYTYTNSSSGSGSGAWNSFGIYKNGILVHQDGGQTSSGMIGQELIFINDSTGFFAYRLSSSGIKLIKTTDYGLTWNLIGQGGPSYSGLYIVNANFAYLVTTMASTSTPNKIEVSRCSDIQLSQWDFIYDDAVDSDKYAMDTVLNSSLCNIDSLNIFIKNNVGDTITYHINKFIPIMGLPINPSPAGCPGRIINVPFAAAAVFSSGNIFTAQLSDASGGFSAPVDIGNITSTSSGTINAVMPSTVALGSNYKIRVVSSSPIYNGTDNGSNISIITNIPIITLSGNILNPSMLPLTAAGPNIMCIGDGAYMYASGATTYTWSDGSHSQNLIVTPTITTTYSVVGENACGTSLDSITIAIIARPVVAVSGASFCPGTTSVTLTASGALTYEWLLSGTSVFSSSLVIGSNISSWMSYNVHGSNGYCETVALGYLVAQTIPTITITGANSLCVGSGAVLGVIGALTYTWDNGATTSSINVNPAVTTTYSVSGENLCGISSETATVIVFNSSPILTISGSNTVCISSSPNLVGSGATTYTWSTGTIGQILNDIPLGNTTYTLLGENACGVSTETLNVTVDPNCQNVWPGDANSDGVADNLDVLELGLHYTLTGSPRLATTNIWQSYFANNWTGNITNGKNLNHSDCNGDGVINDNDTLAIYNNYGFSHTFKPADVSSAPQITIWADQSSVHKNSWGSASIYLGDSSNPVDNINGLALTLSFENPYIETDSIYVEYVPSFLNVSNQNLNFRKIDFSNGKIYTATTHTISDNTNGFGKIAVIHFKINPQLTQDEYLHFGLSAIYKSDSAGTISNVNAVWPSDSETIALATFAGIKENFFNGSFSIVPNPTNDLLTISSGELMQKITVTNVAGQLLLSAPTEGKLHQLQLQNFADGIYFVKVVYANGMSVTKKIVKN